VVFGAKGTSIKIFNNFRSITRQVSMLCDMISARGSFIPEPSA
jgi:hypothetical protein